MRLLDFHYSVDRAFARQTHVEPPVRAMPQGQSRSQLPIGYAQC